MNTDGGMRVDLAPSAALLRHLFLGLSKLVIGVAEEDQPENRDGIFGRLQLGVGTKFVRSVPQTFLQIRVIRRHDF